MTTAAVEIGSSASSYQILAKLAKGGMAEIFLARAATAAGVARFVVLKRVLRERATDFQFLRMFLDEARLAAQLQHPNIAQVYDVGKLGDSYFFTMEYVHGVTVRAVMQQLEHQGPPPIACALAIAAGAAAGLHHAHERIGVDGRPLGIVHRDVSPSNLMVSFEGHVKVVDFGVAKATTRIQETHSGTIKGKISYLSPEQAAGQELDRRSDLFSLGIVLWEMLTGRRLFKRGSDFATMTAIVNESVPPPSSLREGISPDLDALALRALAKRSEDRFQTAQELLDAIEATAAKAGAMLSAGMLSRFVREHFGARPEPWVAAPEHNDVVTVTAEPIPKDLVIPPASHVDRQLSKVMDLSHTVALIDPFEARRTVLMPKVDAGSASITDTGSQRRTTPVPLSDDEPVATEPLPRVTASHARQPRLLPWWIVGAVLAVAASIGLTLAFTTKSAPAPVARAVPDAAVALSEVPDAGGVAIDATEIIAAVAIDAPVEPEESELELEPEPEPEIEIDTRKLGDKKPGRATQKRKPISDSATLVTCTADDAARRPTSCTLVACRVKDDERATRWFAKVPASKRATVIAGCRSAGIKLKPSGPDCDADPARCQF